MAIAPWGTTRMEPFAATVPVPQFTPVIDPETQVAVFVDERGRTVDMGGHGTSTPGLTPTQTTPDGNPKSPTDVDTTESYDQDQSSD
ncbi:putative ATP-grasp-modified RiPP [Kitasatospora brasiliensis]|uniref:putative ATP-grasp-modified RiPP n=1 Tax=Kitasatospora brasiliensis TaxID=3058040 RepID=UPI0029311D0B|nr:putative ATP-grasp-modified RiPP [Kitasatospora sp. K002]